MSTDVNKCLGACKLSFPQPWNSALCNVFSTKHIRIRGGQVVCQTHCGAASWGQGWPLWWWLCPTPKQCRYTLPSQTRPVLWSPEGSSSHWAGTERKRPMWHQWVGGGTSCWVRQRWGGWQGSREPCVWKQMAKDPSQVGFIQGIMADW